MNCHAASCAVSSSVLARHSVLDTESGLALDTGFRRYAELTVSRWEYIPSGFNNKLLEADR
ncbi:Oligopeptidase A. Metallo peptidase. MEROPS family M03A (fragment) [Candidatus Methylomirabilis oxygeniifera]|uniref:Oligopeptidase A. Metallo peptidase. MEROPS family M03A n=1 Tax=Methylomirabilis oxygeniifera TaxID=671143 RepID=D5MFN1_METO1